MKYLTEFLGTFFLVFIIELSSNPLVIGLGLSILIYLGAKFSGAHYNPAVSFSFCLKKTISISVCFLYVVCQIFGAFCAALLISILTERLVLEPNLNEPYFLIILSELFFTFLMILVIFLVAIYPKTKGNKYYGIVIGLTVSLGIFFVGNISSAVFNPAVFIGPAFVDYLNNGDAIQHIYLYSTVTTAGGLLAIIIYNLFFEKNKN